MITRRQLIVRAAATIPFVALASPILGQDRPPALSTDRVKAFVRAGHGNLEEVKKLLEEEPGLLNASWDWGGGDFETALEGAGHTGNREIAEYLLNRGARMTIFVAAMLDRLAIVQGMIEAYPALAQSKGPHGITLLRHAERGEATATLAYLNSLPPQEA